MIALNFSSNVIELLIEAGADLTLENQVVVIYNGVVYSFFMFPLTIFVYTCYRMGTLCWILSSTMKVAINVPNIFLFDYIICNIL